MSYNLYKELRNDIEKHHYMFMSTAIGGDPSSTEIQYISDGFDIYCYLHQESKIYNQLQYNPKVELVIDTAVKRRTKGILVDGIATVVKDENENRKIQSRFTGRYKNLRKYVGSLKSVLYKISSTKIQYIDNTMRSEQTTFEVKENKETLLKTFFRKFRASLSMWIAAMRLPFLTASLGSVLVGASAAYYQSGYFKPGLFWLSLLGVCCAHIGTNMMNDVCDHFSGNDEANKFHNAFSGGSRVIQNGIFSREKVLAVSLIFLLTTVGIGLYLNSVLPGNTILLLGLVGIICGVGYSAPPLKLSHRGLGEISVALGFGIAITLGIYYVQTAELSWLPVIASVPVSIFVFLILFINEFQDSQADKAVGKNTLVVRIGSKRKAIRVYQTLLLIPFIWIIAFIVLKMLPVWTLLMMLVLPLVIKNIKNSSIDYDKIYKLLPVNGLTIAIHFIASLTMAIGFLLDRII